VTAPALAPGRDPAAFVETGVQIALGVVVMLSLSTDLTAAWSAAILAVGGVITTVWVARDKLLPALVGAIKAVFALVVTLGADLNPAVETGLVMAVSAAATFWLRTQVSAPIALDGSRVPKLATVGPDGAYNITSRHER
jgi:nicotinamide riboside transporter PnuC